MTIDNMTLAAGVIFGGLILIFCLMVLYSIWDSHRPSRINEKPLKKNKYIIEYTDQEGHHRTRKYGSYNLFFDTHEAKSKIPKGSKIIQIYGSDNNETFIK